MAKMGNMFRNGFVLVWILITVHTFAQPATTESAGTESDTLTDVIQLTSGFDRAGEAYFSAGMKWIVFQAVPNGEKQFQMFIAKVQSRDDQITGIDAPIRISPANSRNTCGYFSPDGKALIFASTTGKENPDEPTSGYQRDGRDYRWSYPTGMEIFRADDWLAAVQQAKPDENVDLAKHVLTNNDAYDAECAFSPDGKWICFTSNRSGDLELYAMRSDGSNVVQLTHTPGYDGGPFFSPDGKRLLYRSDRRSNNLLQIFVSDLNFEEFGNITGMTNERQLTDDANVNWGPFWHPDGRHIAYATSMQGHTNYEIYLMRDDGSHKTRITYSPGADVLPVFSPDGKYLIWTSKRTKDQTTQIFLAKFQMPASESMPAGAATTGDAEQDKRAAEWVAALALNDPAKEARVKDVIVTHLKAVRDWHNSHPYSTVPDGVNPTTGKKLSTLERQLIADAAISKSVHDDLMNGLRKDLTNEQVETILDKYTEGKVAFTMRGYKAIVPDLTEEEEAAILGFLKQAREQAIEFKGSKLISGVFEIYKTKSEQYLNSKGRDWHALYKAYTDAVKAKKAAATQPGSR